MADITIKINGRTVTAPAGSTILTAARLAGIEIPTLCLDVYKRQRAVLCAALLYPAPPPFVRPVRQG